MEKVEENIEKPASGIYKIRNKINEKYYIGSSNNIQRRWKQHIYSLNKNIHRNSYLQRSWNKYGKNSFDFIILEDNISVDNLLSREQFHLDKTKKNLCFNLSYIAGKVEMTNDVKQKISKRLTGLKRPYKKCDPNVVNRRVESRKWYKHTEETKKKIGKTKIGIPLSTDHKDKMSKSLKGKKAHNTDYTPITFFNKRTQEIFSGIKSDFIKKYNLFKQPVYAMINGNTRLRSYKGWSVLKSDISENSDPHN